MIEDEKFDDELFEVAERLAGAICEKMGANLIEGGSRIDGVDRAMQRVSDLTHAMCRIRAQALAEEADGEVTEACAEVGA